MLLVCLCKVLKGGQEVGSVNKNQDGWIMLFTKDPATSDLFKLVPSTGCGDDKGEKNPQLNRLDVVSLLTFYLWYLKVH